MQDKYRLDKITKKAERVIGKRQDKFDTLCHRRLTNKLADVLRDVTHPLNNKIIQRSGRFREPMIRTTRYAGSCVPSAIKEFNMRIGRTRNDN